MDNFQKSYEKLNLAQKDAVDTIEGPVMVIAGPGTGKTQILTTRIANILLKTDTDPRSILVLTFSESAAKEVRNRLSHLIGTPAYRVEISTFHGFANNIIRNNPEEFPYLISSDTITEVEQIEFIEKIILNNNFKYLKPYGDPLYYLRFALSAINELKKENVNPLSLQETLKKQKTDFENIDDLYHDKGRFKGEMKGKYQDLQKEIAKNEELVFIYQKYQESLEAEKKYDFSDMLLEVVKALETDKNLLLRLQERYQYILIDEHQDTNSSQNRIVELLCNFYDNPNLFVVGDEKQAIYRFQGASLENFLFFKKLYPQAKLINLTENYRSHQTILDASLNLIRNNVTANLLTENKSELIAKSEIVPENLKVIEVSDYHAEGEFIASDIESLKSAGTDLSDIAVIGRNNRDLIELSDSLGRHGIDFSIASDSNIFQDSEIQKLIILFLAINNFGDDRATLKALHISTFEIEPLDIYKIRRYTITNKKTICEVLEKLENNKDLDLENTQRIVSFYQKIKEWEKLSHNENLEKLFIQVLTESGLQQEILKSEKRYEILDKVMALFEEIKVLIAKDPKFNLEKFIQYLDLLQKHDLPLKAEVKSDRIESVKLITAHKSKGTEYNYVYILKCFDGHWGNGRIRNRGFKLPWEYLSNKLQLEDISDVEEDERRLFFVAMTRAKKRLTLTFSNKSLDGKEQLPSQFISEIGQDFLDQVDTSLFEDKFSKSKEIILENTKMTLPKEKEIAFVRDLFLERGLSATSFGNYLECPWKFFYLNLLSLPESKSGVMSYGIAIHFAMESYIQSLKTKALTLSQLKNKFKESLTKEALNQLDFDSFLEKGEVVLEKIYKVILPSWKDKKIDSEVSIKSIKLTDKINLSGRLDMLEQLENKDDFIVHDFKTGKPKSRRSIDGSNPTSKTNYLQQLVFYKLLLEKFRDGNKKMISGVIDFLEPDEKGNFKSESFDITDGQVEDLNQQIISVGDQIWNLSFWEEFCGNKDCEYCELRVLLGQ